MSSAGLMTDGNSVAVGQHPAPALDIDLPGGFAQTEALSRITAYVAAQFHAGLSEREIMWRLHGWVPGGEA